MADRDGGRHVLMTLPTGALPSLGDAGEALLDGALDESPALVWLKDLDGRYVRVNSRFTTLLSTSEERLLGRTDAELPPAETVDGPRAQDRVEGVEEPLQLEYMVEPFQGRDAFVVLRFPVSDRHGIPTLVCGVAAPSSEAQVARSEAARLLRVERWSRLDAESVRAELLAEWGLLPDARGSAVSALASRPVPGSAEHEAAVAEARAERATAVAERDSALSANDKLNAELHGAQARLAELERTLRTAQAEGERGDAETKLAERAAELDRAMTRERERADDLERTLTLVRQRLGDDAEAARAEVQRARADAAAARTELERARADAEGVRAQLEKARVEANSVRGAAAAERESAASARAELEHELRRSQDQLIALERQRGAEDAGAQMRAAEKARVAAEAAVAEAITERDAALKARAALNGELEQERNHVADLRVSVTVAEERIREITGELERERVRAAGLEPAQGRLRALEDELRLTVMRADKAGVEFEVAVARAERAESQLRGAATRAGAAEDELRVAVGRADRAEIDVEKWRDRAERAESEVERGRARIGELEDELGRARAKAEEDAAVLADAEARLEEAGSQRAAIVADAAARQEADEPVAIELARLEPTAEREGDHAAGGVSWQPAAKRALSASLARESVWRSVLKQTVEVLGSEGGWDTVTAWLPDDSNRLGCAATWTGHRGLDRFEALTSDTALAREGSLLDQALQAPHLTWLTDIDAVDDARLQTAAAHGMNSALLLPVRSGTTTIGLLELLTHETVEPDAQIALSLEASALQLGRFGHLLSLGSK
jgi:hypothetical protein